MPNEDFFKIYPDLNISWASKDGSIPLSFAITGNGFQFKVSPMQNAKPEKIIMTLKSGNQTLGYRAYYFGMRYSKR